MNLSEDCCLDGILYVYRIDIHICMYAISKRALLIGCHLCISSRFWAHTNHIVHKPHTMVDIYIYTISHSTYDAIRRNSGRKTHHIISKSSFDFVKTFEGAGANHSSLLGKRYDTICIHCFAVALTLLMTL